MADENFLSQEDIDALMAGMSGGDDSGNSDGGNGGDLGGGPPDDAGSGGSGGSGGLNPERIRPAIDLMLRQASTVVSTVMNKNTDFVINELGAARADNFSGSSGQFASDTLNVKVNFNSGLSGSIHFVISHADTARLADLMMMGDGTADYEEDHRDALAELVNQIMGAVSTSLGTELGISISPDQSEVGDYDPSEPPVSPDNSAQANLKLGIEDFEDSEVILLLDPELVESLMAHYGEDDFAEPSVGKAEVSELEDVMGSSLELDAPRGGSPIYNSSGNPNVDMLMDVPLDVTIELGRSNISIRKVLELGPGSIVELDKKASEPVDLMVNDKLVAKGEVVVVDEYFGIRIVSLVSPEERIKHLR